MSDDRLRPTNDTGDFARAALSGDSFLDGAFRPTPGSGEILPGRIGDFTVLHILGEGGMGTVYLAEDTRLGRKAAIKTMRPELAAKPHNRQRFVREARAAAAVEHDNIVPIWQVGELADGRPFIAMPYLVGETLSDRLAREPVSHLGVVLKVARDVADGLAAAHSKGLIHRDIKPCNVWLEGDPDSDEILTQVRRCKILDFGLVRSAEDDDANLTGGNTIVGTPAFMSPEQARGLEVDARTDLFSLGSLLYRMATGSRPFEGSNSMAVLISLATTTPAPARALNPALPPALGELIDRLLCKDPAGRPQSAAAVSAVVRRLVKELQGRTNTPRPSEGAMTTVPMELSMATVVRAQTPWGTMVIELSDADWEVRIKGGRLILAGRGGAECYTLRPGDRGAAPGTHAVRVEGTDGLTLDTPEFTLKRNAKVVVRVAMETPGEAPPADPDREAATRVLGLGGTVRVNGADRVITTVGELPEGPVQLMGVGLESNPRVNDAWLANLKRCKGLKVLSLVGARVGDAGLAHFTGLNLLLSLNLCGTRVTDAGLAPFAVCKKLRGLDLGGTKVGDAGLAHFTDCPKLEHLSLAETRTGDTGLMTFRNCKRLKCIILRGTRVSDPGLSALVGCEALLTLDLSGTKVGDAGLVHLRGSYNLTALHLAGTAVTDAGLAALKGLKILAELDLRGAKVTAAGVADLAKALPKCKIEWDGAA